MRTRVAAIVSPFPSGIGGHAEIVVAPRYAVAVVPDAMELTHAATVPMNGFTALRSVTRLGLDQGSGVLTPGAAGAVGGYAVELASRAGLQVIAVTAAEDAV